MITSANGLPYIPGELILEQFGASVKNAFTDVTEDRPILRRTESCPDLMFVLGDRTRSDAERTRKPDALVDTDPMIQDAPDGDAPRPGWEPSEGASIMCDAATTGGSADEWSESFLDCLGGMDEPPPKRHKTTGIVRKITERARSSTHLAEVQTTQEAVAEDNTTESWTNDKERAKAMLDDVGRMVPTNTSWQAEAEGSLKDRRSKEVALKDLVASLAIIKELSDGSVTSGKITLRDKLFIFLLRYGEGFRSHDGELYEYEESGAWLNRKTCTVDMRPSLNLVEGILYKLSESITEEQLWNWEVVKAGLLDVLRNAANDGSSLLAFKQSCKEDCAIQMRFQLAGDWREEI